MYSLWTITQLGTSKTDMFALRASTNAVSISILILECRAATLVADRQLILATLPKPITRPAATNSVWSTRSGRHREAERHAKPMLLVLSWSPISKAKTVRAPFLVKSHKKEITKHVKEVCGIFLGQNWFVPLQVRLLKLL